MKPHMFEVYNRHTPMFVASDIKQLADIFKDALQINNNIMGTLDVEIIDISQTVRIKKDNMFIIKSDMNYETIISIFKKSSVIQQLRNRQDLLRDVLKYMIAKIGIDAYVCIGTATTISGLDDMIPKATESAKKPLIIFNEPKQLPGQSMQAHWFDVDHPALWLGQGWESVMEETEAFFAMSPELKLETELNRYRTIERFGDFSVGMVRF